MMAFKKEIYSSGGFQVTERIYALKHPDTKDVFYIGKTKKPLCDRLHGHISAAKGKSEKFRNTIKDQYILEILASGKRPMIETVEKITPISYIEFLEISEREIYWMKHFQDKGCSIMNIMGLRIIQPNAKYLWYVESRNKGSVGLEYYYCGKDKDGNSLYHKERMLIDGMEWVDEIRQIEYRKQYNPYNNPIWMKKMGIAG